MLKTVGYATENDEALRHINGRLSTKEARILAFAKQGLALLSVGPNDLDLMVRGPSSLLYRLILGALAPYRGALIEATKLTETRSMAA